MHACELIYRHTIILNSFVHAYYLMLYSSVTFRQYIYSEEGREFSELRPPLSHTRCVTVVEHFIHQLTCSNPEEGDRPARSSAFLCSSATDGKVAVWCLDSCIAEWVHSVTALTGSAATNASQEDSATVRASQEEHFLTAKTNLAGASLSTGTGCTSPTAVFQAHQSGINDIAISSHGELLCNVLRMCRDDCSIIQSLFGLQLVMAAIPLLLWVMTMLWWCHSARWPAWTPSLPPLPLSASSQNPMHTHPALQVCTKRT